MWAKTPSSENTVEKIVRVLLNLLLSVNCQTNVAFRAIRSFCSPSHVNSPLCEKCGSAHLAFSFSAGTATFFTTKILPRVGLDFLSTMAFRAAKILSTLRADIPVAFISTKHLKTLCFPSAIGVDKRSLQRYENPVSSRSWRPFRPYLSELPKFCQL